MADRAHRPEALARTLVRRARRRREEGERRLSGARAAALEVLGAWLGDGSIRRGWLIGSAAWGGAHRRSDLDVVVEGAPEDGLGELWDRISDACGLDVDLSGTRIWSPASGGGSSTKDFRSMGPEARQSAEALTTLRQELAEDRAAMESRRGEMEEARSRLAERPWSSHAAVALHGWYTVLEAALERIVRTLDGDVPAGDRRHRDLLSQATVGVPGVRPAVLPRELLPDLLELLAFRHLFRHAYGAEVDPSRLEAQIDRVHRISPRIGQGLDDLDAHLGGALEALASDDPD